jgi:outer membrane protein OmpA-like peptidoglycan-associated protein
VKAIVAAALAAAFSGAANDTAHDLRFVACPTYRDTDAGAKSGCWLVDDPASGIRYDVSRAPSKPDWNAAVLVEGRQTGEAANPCGGVVLEPVRTSVLDQPCTRFMLEAEGYPGRKFTLPQRNVRPLYEERKRPDRPFAARTIMIPFDFGKAFIVYQLSDYYIDQAINYALDVQPARVTVTGFAASNPSVVSGKSLAEPEALAKTRAELVARALVLRGVPRAAITVATGAPSVRDDEAFDGLRAPSQRRVEVSVSPLVQPEPR